MRDSSNIKGLANRLAEHFRVLRNGRPTSGLAGFFSLIAVLFMTPTLAQKPKPSGTPVQDCIVRFAQEVKVPALETGRVAELSVKINDMVKTGNFLARLDDRSLLIRRRAALLRLNSAKSDSTDDIETRFAELALAEAEAELDTSRLIQNDVVGAVPRSQLRKLKLAVERGEVEVALAKKKRRRAEVETELREADLSEIDDQLQNLHTASPIDGVVLEVARSAGEWIAKGDTIATIGRIDRLHVHALIDSREIAPTSCRDLPVSVHWTDPATGKERSLRGKVLSSDPQMLPGGRFRLHAEIINEPDPGNPNQWQLKPGAEVRMKVYQAASTARRQSLIPSPTAR
ncbi:MAG: efflux RND transporter periplasmic adaptor subunit [Rubripirellula sp.]